jgi:hypothetical protein
MSADLGGLLASGRGYLWATRLAWQDGDSARAALEEAGIDVPTLLALKELEPSLARFAHPTARRTDGRHVLVTVPEDIPVYFCSILTERGAEMGTELFPGEVVWTFAHRETQYCIGGDTPVEATLPHGDTRSWRTRVGDVVSVPAGTTLHTHSTEEGDAFGHAHIFLSNLGQHEPQTYYDAIAFLRLQQIGALDGEAPPLESIDDRLEVTDWSQLVRPTGRESDLPTWLRNGWAAREATRALAYGEGGRTVAVASPDREPADYLPWGEGPHRCYVNPLVAEASSAVTDCRLPAGYARSHPGQELWTTLTGQARLRLTVPPLHAEETSVELAPGVALVVPAGARVLVDDADEDLVVRRMAESCASNGHWAMMEAKLEADGVPAQL